jgi:hypothetical protein
LFALKNTARFNPDGSLSTVHANLASDPLTRARRSGVPFEEGEADMFLYNEGDTGRYEQTKVLGQMTEASLPYSGLAATADTVVARVLEVQPDIRKDLQAGLNLINKLYARKINDGDLADLIKASTAAMTSSTAAGEVLAGNEFGAHDLDSHAENTALPEDGGYLPAGYGSVAGLYTIADVNPHSRIGRAIGKETLKTAQAFTEAVDSLYKATAAIFSDSHPIYSGEHVPEHFTSSYSPGSAAQRDMHAKIALAQSMLDEPKEPLLFSARGTNSSSSSSASSVDLLEPLADAIADDVSESESHVIAAVRRHLATAGSAETQAAFATAATIRDFRAVYSASPFAAAFKRYSKDKAADAAEKAAADTTAFSLFATTHLADVLATADESAVANTMHGLVDAVVSTQAVRTNQVEAKLTQWAQTQAPRAPARSAAAASPSSAVVGGTVRTRFVMSPIALSRIRGDHPFSLAGVSPSAANPASAFAFSASSHRGIGRVDFETDYGTGYRERGAQYLREGALIRAPDASYLNQSFRNRWARASKERDGLQRAAIELLMLDHLRGAGRGPRRDCVVAIQHLPLDERHDAANARQRVDLGLCHCQGRASHVPRRGRHCDGLLRRRVTRALHAERLRPREHSGEPRVRLLLARAVRLAAWPVERVEDARHSRLFPC